MAFLRVLALLLGVTLGGAAAAAGGPFDCAAGAQFIDEYGHGPKESMAALCSQVATDLGTGYTATATPIGCYVSFPGDGFYLDPAGDACGSPSSPSGTGTGTASLQQTEDKSLKTLLLAFASVGVFALGFIGSNQSGAA